MWALIHKIASHESQNMNEVEIYSLALEQANAKYIYVKALPEAEDILRKSFRAVRVVRPDEENGREFIIYKCFVGSSKLDTKEKYKGKETSEIVDQIIFSKAEMINLSAIYRLKKYFHESNDAINKFMLPYQCFFSKKEMGSSNGFP